jgi:hypothetical protein
VGLALIIALMIGLSFLMQCKLKSFPCGEEQPWRRGQVSESFLVVGPVSFARTTPTKAGFAGAGKPVFYYNFQISL